MMAKVEIYYWTTCPYCKKARALLESKDVEYIGYDITGKEDERKKMIERTGGPKSVPQIFINDDYVGGCDDLHAMDDRGELDKRLKA
ncbi:MAG: glutaredoxin 3 [Micavibrio sp.]|nr:glutaredoxin 3 [Micavibrio sp.]